MAIDILVVDDERDIRELVSGILEDEGYDPRMAADSDAVFAAVKDRLPAMVILDIWLQGSKLDGLGILAELKQVHPDLPVIVISGHGNVETAIAAIRKGAYDYIEKPFNADKLILTVKRALENAQLRRENTDLKEKSSELTLIGDSNVMVQLRSMIDRIADARSRVMIEGPVGSGKEVVARRLHRHSKRSGRPFVVVSSASIDPARMEEALFGIEGDDGRPRMIGLMEQAHGGTLLFDEVGDMPIETQNKILRVLVDQRFTRVGGTTPVTVDVRIVSTTSVDLLAAAEDGRFRKDLYHRLAVVHLATPSLTARREDIPALADHFLKTLAESGGFKRRHLTDEAAAALQTYTWPGNVRQLRNVLERTLIVSGRAVSDAIGIEQLPEEVVQSGPRLPAGETMEQIIALPLREARERFEREYLVAQIARFAGNISRTAAFIGMERSALHRKLKALGVTSNNRED
ncbi:sigma-54 dependent transcriptional regulator [Parvularcula sp. LCG005]|uniref:nitrogen assimilation response regulator NtrX n=1 Tax=Parvularcula sp. LCG005 TaxID=3078805 RepID=UPI00294270F2|nr:sigma-54 dependent transcriptional regulator [Parvularcula sp. LCG005]WOI54075.1 sigma-54 dependent transcriptional regulator [Parvularcula sp. LCG005]